MRKHHFLNLLLSVVAVATVNGTIKHHPSRSNYLYVEWMEVTGNAGIHISAVSGEEFYMHDIVVDGVFRPSLTLREPGSTKLWTELIYPIPMSPPCAVMANTRTIDFGEEEIRRRCYPKRPKTILIHSSRGDYHIDLSQKSPFKSTPTPLP